MEAEFFPTGQALLYNRRVANYLVIERFSADKPHEPFPKDITRRLSRLLGFYVWKEEIENATVSNAL